MAGTEKPGQRGKVQGQQLDELLKPDKPGKGKGKGKGRPAVPGRVARLARQGLEASSHRGVLVRWHAGPGGGSWSVATTDLIEPGTVVLHRQEAAATWSARHWPTL